MPKLTVITQKLEEEGNQYEVCINLMKNITSTSGSQQLAHTPLFIYQADFLQILIATLAQTGRFMSDHCTGAQVVHEQQAASHFFL